MSAGVAWSKRDVRNRVGDRDHRRAGRSEHGLPGRPVESRERHQYRDVGKSSGQGVTRVRTVAGKMLMLLRDDDDLAAGASRAASIVSAGRVDTTTVPSQRSQPSPAGHRSRAGPFAVHIVLVPQPRWRPGQQQRCQDPLDLDASSCGRQAGEDASPPGTAIRGSAAPRRTLTTSTSWFDARCPAVVKVARMTPPTPDALMIRKRTRRRVTPDAGASSRVHVGPGPRPPSRRGPARPPRSARPRPWLLRMRERAVKRRGESSSTHHARHDKSALCRVRWTGAAGSS